MALNKVDLANSIYDNVFTVNGVDEHGYQKGPSSTDEFAEKFVPIFIDWFETASILVTGTAKYTNVQSGATVSQPGNSSPMIKEGLLIESTLISALKQDLDNGVSGAGASAAKGWPLFCAALTSSLSPTSIWANSAWIASDITITGGSCYPFLLDIHSEGEAAGLTAPGSALRDAADDHAEALYNGILSYSVSSTIGAKHISSEAAVAAQPPTLEFVSGATVALTLI